MYIATKYSVPEGNPTLWRYLSFSKFLDLINTSALYFCRLDKFSDPLECTQPNGSFDFAMGTNNPWQMYEREYLNAHLYMLKQMTFVSCWHINETENVFMWDNYAAQQGNEGVAIKTDLNAIKTVLSEVDRRITDMVVSYVDFQTYYMNYFMANPFDFISVKDLSFSLENELRLITFEEKYPDIDEDDVICRNKIYCEHIGEHIHVDLNKLIHCIYLSPNSTQRFEELIKNLLEANNLKIEVKKSML